MSHTKFTSIESFSHVYRGQQRFADPEIDFEPYSVRYGAKIKLHGTNASVRIDPDGTVIAQGRNRDLTVAEDHYGFASWVKEHEAAWVAFSETMRSYDTQTVVAYGEWAGKGIQKKDAVTKLDQKYFFVFSVLVDEAMYLDPDFIEIHIPDLDNVLVLPWHIGCEDALDYSNADQCKYFGQWADHQAQIVGTKDPFIYETFGIEGPGEGLVFTPYLMQCPLDYHNTVIFKAKTKGHNTKAQKTQRDLVIPEGVTEFVELFVTNARCEQGLTEACDGVAEPQRTNDFLKWMGKDVKKESAAEIEDGDLNWKDVSKAVTNAARTWFLDKCQEI